MAVQNYFILNSAQRDTAMGYNTPDASINPRAVDNASPGTGINLNDQAADFDPSDPVTLTGLYVAPKLIVDDPAYLQYTPDLLTFLLTMPWASLENETIYAPEEL